MGGAPRSVRTVVHFTDSQTYGGAERATVTLLRTLDRARWRLVVVHHPARGIAPLDEAAHELGVPVYVTPRIHARNAAWRLPALALRLAQLRADVLHAQLSWPAACQYGLIAARAARVRAIVATEHLFLPISGRHRLLRRIAARAVARHVAVSREVARGLHRELGVPGEKLRIVPNGIEPFEPVPPDRALRMQWTRGTDRPVVLTLARLDEQKGHRYLVEAAALLPNAVFVLAGDGPLRASLEERGRTLGVGDRVVFVGDRRDVPKLLATCDVFVLPSLYEGLPLSVLEAMAARRPVVATAVGGTDEAVRDGETGILVPPGNPAALAAAIGRVLDDRALRDGLVSAAARAVDAEFSAGRTASMIAAVYDEVLGARDA